MAKEKVLVSACLAGINCVYDGTNKLNPVFAKMFERGEALIFCPEVLGGLNIPHDPSEISGGDGFDVLSARARVVSKKGDDVTPYFLKGAEKVLRLAQKHGIRCAVMKSKSPSCGCGFIFDGTFSKKLIAGYGVTAALLKKNGVEVESDIEYLKRNAEKKRK
ncbi:MAG: DUF523 domain-containing protein [Candidatus Omnitrophica bacterium]|nr:DUF523 domain-containing protein [Candidatus Omnitrophota bacterium]